MISTSSMHYDLCPICQGSHFRKQYNVDGFEIDKCNDCEVVFVRNIMTVETLASYYETAASDEFIYTSENIYYLNHYYNKLKREIYRITGKTSGNILDVGCSGGYFLDIMQEWDRYGIEISDKEASIAKSKYGDNILSGVIEDYPVRESFFDVITLQDVLDHCINPTEVIDSCYKMLKPGGLIIIKVHDISCLYARISGKTFYAILPPFHLFYFSKKPLAFILTRSGFRHFKFKHIGQIIQLKTVFYRLSKGNKNSFFYKIYLLLSRFSLGNIPIPKNLHDIITVFATKE